MTTRSKRKLCGNGILRYFSPKNSEFFKTAGLTLGIDNWIFWQWCGQTLFLLPVASLGEHLMFSHFQMFISADSWIYFLSIDWLCSQASSTKNLNKQLFLYRCNSPQLQIRIFGGKKLGTKRWQTWLKKLIRKCGLIVGSLSHWAKTFWGHCIRIWLLYVQFQEAWKLVSLNL